MNRDHKKWFHANKNPQLKYSFTLTIMG
jgi:hypothetical protein